MNSSINRILIVSILLVIQFTFSQKKPSLKEELRKKFWTQNTSGFQETKVPERWKNESSVILSRSYEYEIEKEVFLLLVHENHYVHERVKLLDNAAVEKYSEFSFNSRYGNNGFFATQESAKTYAGFKVIKADGSEIEIDLDNAVKKNIKSPGLSAESKSIAIPNLQKGDIIDYYYLKKKSTVVDQETGFKKFESNYVFLKTDEPILKQQITLRAMRQCFITANSVNGGPKAKFSNDIKNKESTFSVVLENQDKVDIDNKKWYSSKTELPIVKFQGFYSLKKGKEILNLYGINYDKTQKINSDLPNSKILELVNALTSWESTFSKLISSDSRNYGTSEAYGDINNHIKKYTEKNASTEELVKRAYYYFRQLEFRKTYESNMLFNKKAQYAINSAYFARNMSRFLENRKIDHSILITNPSHITKFEDMSLSNELIMLIKINGPKPYYLCNFDRYTNFKDISSHIQGNDAYQIDFTKNVKSRKISKVKIPISSAEESTNFTSLDINFNSSNMLELLIHQNVKLTGSIKGPIQTLVLTPYDYIYDSKNEIFETELLIDQASKKKKNSLNQRIKEKQNQDNEDRNKRIAESLKSEFNLTDEIKIEKIEILSTGLWDEEPDFNYSTQFKISEFVKKVGDNYLLDLGKLIGAQVEISKNTIDLPYNMLHPFARTFKNTFNITIPNDYSIKGIDKLNFNVSNDFAEFISIAKINSNVLTIKTSKIYKTKFIKAADMNKIIEVLEAANSFYQQRVLLSK